MKKTLLFLSLFLGLAILSNVAVAQLLERDVTFLVIDGTESYQKIMLKGTMWNNWEVIDMLDDGTGEDETAGDHIWTKTIAAIDTGTYSWGAIEDDGTQWGIWLLQGVPNREFTVHEDGTVTGDTTFTIEAGPEEIEVTFEVVDGTLGYVKIMIKGSMYQDWTPVDMNDDGTEEQDSVGDHVWHLTIADIPIDDSYEWSIIEDDGSEQGIALITGENPMFDIDDQGNVTGVTRWIIPGSGPTMVDVTFTVTDETDTLTALQYKGTVTGWAVVDMYDDGTNGDETADDHIWTVVIEDVEIGTYHSWGAVEDDGSDYGIWLGSGGKYGVLADGTVTGSTTLTLESEGTGIRELKQDPYVFYPNPVNNVLHIKNLTNVKSIVVRNVLGQEIEVFTSVAPGEFRINTSEYVNGIYIVTILSNDGYMVSEKIIK